MTSAIERGIFLLVLFLVTVAMKMYYHSREYFQTIGPNQKWTDNIDLEYHDTIDNLLKSDTSNIMNSDFQVVVYGNSTSPSNQYILDVSVGSFVEVNSQNKGIWLAGKVIADHGDYTYDIQYVNPNAIFKLSTTDSVTVLSSITMAPKPMATPSVTTQPHTTLPPITVYDDLYSTPSSTVYDPTSFSIQYNSDGTINSIIEKNVNMDQIRTNVTIQYNSNLGFPTYYTPGSSNYGMSSYVPSYSDSVYLSKTFNFLPKSAYSL
jgi:hypothetical protein